MTRQGVVFSDIILNHIFKSIIYFFMGMCNLFSLDIPITQLQFECLLTNINFSGALNNYTFI